MGYDGLSLLGKVKLPPHLLAALVPLLVVVLALDVYCLADIARAKQVRGAPKLAWVIVIVCFSAPLGAVLYLFFGKDRGQSGTAVHGRPGQARLATSLRGGQAPGTADDGGRIDLADRRPDSRPPILTTTGLTRDYGGGAGLFGVDLFVPLGSIYGLVGPNGAGKTTLLSILSGVRRAGSGTVSLTIGRDRLAVCPDVPEFDAWLTASEVVDLSRALVTGNRGGDRDATDAAVLAALTTAGLADSARRRVGGFSRGMLQRLGLACALVADPELLILDEPMSALDPAGRAEMLNLVAEMRSTKTVIFSSHILADVQRIADQVGILRDGKLLYQGATGDLIERYLQPSWLVKVVGDVAPVAAAMSRQGWATKVEPAGGGTIRVDAESVAAGERGIPAVIAACAARLVSCEPLAADLESAFLALTSQPMAPSHMNTAR